MKKFILFVGILGASVWWFSEWVTSGRVDNFLREHPHPVVTPRILYSLAGLYHGLNETKAARHYYRWIVDQFPGHKDIARIRYELAQCCEDNSDFQAAMDQYIVLKDSFTNTAYGRLGQSKFDRSKF